VGIVKKCPNKSFAVILKRTEAIGGEQKLHRLAESLAPREVLGAFVALNVQGKQKSMATLYQFYSKAQFNGNNPSYADLENILNFLRVFHTDCFKILPQFALRTIDGVYYNDRFAFLEQFLFMVRNLTEKHDYPELPHSQRVKWFVKKNSAIFDIPNRINLFNELVISTGSWELIDRVELKRHLYKLESYAMTYNIDHLVQSGISMEEFAVFNPADQYEPFTVRDKPQLIPRIIHSVWVGE
jgi:hypothetical protein